MGEKKTIASSKSVRDFLEKTAGEHAVELIELWQSHSKPFNDEEMAGKTGLKVTDIRTILNRLHYRGISDYQKTRDKKTGWYSYVWAINRKRILELVIEEQEEALESLETQKKAGDEYTFFRCKNKCQDLEFEIAAEYDFKCPQCGKPMNAVNHEQKRKKFAKQIQAIKKEIDMLKELA